jgi:hypothetical protein
MSLCAKNLAEERDSPTPWRMVWLQPESTTSTSPRLENAGMADLMVLQASAPHKPT